MREQAKRKVIVLMYSGYCFYSKKMTTPQEEAVYVICKSNMRHDGTSDSLKDASIWHLFLWSNLGWNKILIGVKKWC